MAANNQTVTETEPLSEPTDADVEQSDDDQATESEPDQSEETESLPLDQVFEILKNKRRRTVLQYLETHEEPVSLSDLAEHVAADENDTTVRQVTSRERKCAYVGLYQCHLPKMDNMDIIDFNQNRGRIELGRNASQLEEYLDYSESTARPWPLFYGSVAGAGSLLVVTSYLAVGPGLAPLVSCLAVLTAVGALAGAHLRSESGTENARQWVIEHWP